MTTTEGTLRNPANISFMRTSLVNGMTNDYVGVVFDEMLDEVGADTARLSILWSERVRLGLLLAEE